MIKCPTLKLLFSHVPKTGGSTITDALMPYSAAQNTKTRGPGWQHGFHFRSRMHAPWRRVAPWAAPLIDEGWTHIAVWRPPAARVLSMFRRRGPVIGVTDLDSYLRRCLCEEKLRSKSRHKANRPIPTALRVVGPRVTHWLRFDKLQEDWDALPGLEASPLPRRNVTPYQRSDEELLTPFARNWIAARYSADIAYARKHGLYLDACFTPK